MKRFTVLYICSFILVFHTKLEKFRNGFLTLDLSFIFSLNITQKLQQILLNKNDVKSFHLDREIWITLLWISGSNYLDQNIWIKLSGPIYLDQIIWIKLFGSNYLDQNIWIKLSGSNYLEYFKSFWIILIQI